MKINNEFIMATGENSDRALIKQYLHGDEKSFDALYERYRRPVYSYLSGMFPGRSDLADEIYQQTWIKVIKNLPRYRDKNTFISWIIRIARNAAMDHFRRNARFLPLEEISGESSENNVKSPLQDIINQHEYDALKMAVANLPEDQREVVLLRLQDIPFKEIARIQKVSINTALGRMRYAIAALRETMKK